MRSKYICHGKMKMADLVDMEVIEELRDIMEEDFPSLLESFLSESEKQFAQASQAWQSDDYDTLRRSVHSLKGSCGNVGAQQLQATCDELEGLARYHQPERIPELLSQVGAQLTDVTGVIKSL